MDAGAPGERSNQHGEPRRSLESLDCLGMLPATPANMLASVQHIAAAVRWESAMRRHRVPRKRRAPTWGLEWVAGYSSS